MFMTEYSSLSSISTLVNPCRRHLCAIDQDWRIGAHFEFCSQTNILFSLQGGGLMTTDLEQLKICICAQLGYQGCS